MLGRMVPAVHLLVRHVDVVLLKELQEQIIQGLAKIAEWFTASLFPDPVQLFNEAPIGEPATVSPQIILYAATALTHWIRLCAWVCEREDRLSAGGATTVGRPRLENQGSAAAVPGRAGRRHHRGHAGEGGQAARDVPRSTSPVKSIDRWPAST